MAFCQKGKELLLDLKRAEWMPKYDEETVRAIIEETNQLFNKMVQLGGMDKDDNAVKLSKIYHKDCMDRNKKYLQAYEVYRMDKVRQLGWLSGGSAAIIPKNILENEILSLDEIDYFTAYNKAISDYSDAVNIDLTSSIEPPKEYFIVIRVLEEYGEILTENGPLNLIKGSSQYVRRTDVEDLIRQGIVEHISSELV